MPWFLCFQLFGISYLEVGLSLSWEVLCLVWKDYYVDWFPSAARRGGVHIPNVVPGPRPRTGFGGGDDEHCPLLWWYAVGTDQATKLHIWWLIFQSQCIGNGNRRMFVCLPSCWNWSFLPFKVFVRWIVIFYVCLNYWKLFAIMITTWGRSSRRWIELLYFVVLLRCISQLQTVLIPRLWFWFGIPGHLLDWRHTRTCDELPESSQGAPR